MQRLEDRENPAGTVDAFLTAGGVLILTGDDAANDVQVQLSAAGAVVTGTDTQITANGSTGATATLTGTVRSVNVNLRGGDDRLALDAAGAFNLTGNATLNLGEGDNTLTVGTVGALGVDGNLTVRALDGRDTVTITGGASAAVGGNLSLSLGNGGSAVTLQNLTVNGGGGIRLAAGEGDDAVALNAVVASRGGVAVLGGAGRLDLDLAGAVDVNRALAVTGRGDVDITLPGGTLGGLAVTGGSFADTTVTVSGPVALDGNASVRGHDATLDLTAGALTVNGNLALSAGAAATLNAAAGTTLGVTGSLSVSSLGEATLNAAGAGLTVGRNLLVRGQADTDVTFATAGAAQVGGNLTVHGGTGDDTFTADADLDVSGNLTLILGGGDNTVTLGATGGTLNVDGGVAVHAGAGADSVSLNGVLAGRASRFLLGGGADTLSIQNGTAFQKAVVANLGLGDDVLNIATEAGAAVTFNGQANLITGAGNDTATLGLANDPTRSVVFLAAQNLLDLGPGLDVFAQANANFSGSLTVRGDDD